jgi:predicted nucleic acid-binding protein
VATGLVIAVDSSAWIAGFRSESSSTKTLLVDAITNHTLLVPDLILAEVLRGARTESDAKALIREFASFRTVEIGGQDAALKSALNYRLLRAKGVTIRGTIDVLLATWCITHRVPLLHDDRDFDGFEKHLGLNVWRGAV